MTVITEVVAAGGGSRRGDLRRRLVPPRSRPSAPRRPSCKAQTSSQEAPTRASSSRSQMLQAQQEELPQQRAQLAVHKKQLPDNPALPTLIRNLTAAGRKIGATHRLLAPALPVALVAASAVAPVADDSRTGDGRSTTETTVSRPRRATDATTTPAPAAAAPPAPALYQVPLTVSRDRQLLRARAVRQQARGPPALLPGDRLHGRGPSRRVGGAAGDLALTLDGRVFLTRRADHHHHATPVASTPAAAVETRSNGHE